ncbi:protein-L-isoaspartate O-methyltransferase family protein [Phycicoccus sonneratiae]|uniref:Protein-L-isoaspartate O-methyltransferase n=1 Tax=Phycicoccus sonneratiae TaxID=2807628 RepID=A0ABS2CKE5_9MICO|nr:methyltransferase domain-containing protein [Phycicoccus sonneraticus]MBM6400354.1 methyltransferase domain-containing protein [Phycicoccus sonneraticus]
MTPAAALDAAFAAQPRERFLPPERRAAAGTDAPLDIGHGQTSSQPRTVRAMLGLLDVRPGHRVLDVGSGSAWTTALLAELVGPGGSVLGVERVPELVAVGAQRLEASGVLRATIRPADPDVLGAAADGPFDRILVSAMATRIPRELVDQLAPGGVLVVPVAGVMTRVERPGRAGAPTVTEHGRYRFVPLVGG